MIVANLIWMFRKEKKLYIYIYTCTNNPIHGYGISIVLRLFYVKINTLTSRLFPRPAQVRPKAGQKVRIRFRTNFGPGRDTGSAGSRQDRPPSWASSINCFELHLGSCLEARSINCVFHRIRLCGYVQSMRWSWQQSCEEWKSRRRELCHGEVFVGCGGFGVSGCLCFLVALVVFKMCVMETAGVCWAIFVTCHLWLKLCMWSWSFGAFILFWFRLRAFCDAQYYRNGSLRSISQVAEIRFQKKKARRQCEFSLIKVRALFIIHYFYYFCRLLWSSTL